VYSDVQHFAVALLFLKVFFIGFLFCCLRPVSWVPNNASFSGLSLRFSLAFFEDTKGQKKKVKRAHNDLENITQKTKDGATRTQLKTRF
jgi:hypothetical protein